MTGRHFILRALFLLMTTMLSLSVGAKINMGTIELQVGQETKVYSEPSTYYTVSGSWSKVGNAFYISARSQRSCTIRAINVGTSTLEWMGVINARDAEMVWTIKVTAATVKVTGINLNKSQMELPINGSEQLTATVSPSNATNKSVSWSSSNTGVASVSSTGLVNGISAGTTTITCKATDGSGVSATCKVTVLKEPTSISLPSEMSIGVGETVTIPYTLQPENSSSSITWKSSNTSIATVSSSGEVTGVKEGTTTVTATTSNGKSASCKVTVDNNLVRPTKITLYGCSVEVGFSTKMSCYLTPDSAITALSWKSSDTSIATVSSDGIVKGIKQGSARITATTSNGLSAWATIYVGGFKEGTTFNGTSSDDYDVTYRVTDINAKTCAVDVCRRKAKEYVIPSSVQGYKVTSVGKFAFENCKLESITLPNSLTTIEYGAFRGCKFLRSISIPNSVTSIGGGVFSGCEKLESVVLSNKMSRIEGWMFYNCKSLTSLSGFSSVEYVAPDAGLNSIPWFASLPDGENYIGRVLFKYKGTMPENTTIKVKDGCTQIASGAFSNQYGLVAITIPSSLVTLESNPFFGCHSLRNITVSADNPIFDSRDNCNAVIKTKENELVIGCVGTTIPNTVKSIGSYAFAGNASLQEINIPDNIDSIADYAYNDAYNVKEITIGKGLRILGHLPFEYCSRVRRISVSKSNPYFDSRDNCNAIIETATDRLRLGCSNTIIPNTVKIIGVSAFADNNNIASITIPNSVTAIEAGAFWHMSNLRSITIGKNVKNIGKNLFIDNNKLTLIRSLIDFPTDIDKDVFRKGYGQEDSIYNHITLYIPKGSKANYQSAEGWKNFKHIVEIGDDEAYSGMFFTEKTVEGAELTYMVTDAEKKECELFASPTDVKGKVTIPSLANEFTVRSIGEEVFYSSKNERALTEVVIPNTIRTVGFMAFGYCEDMVATIPSSLTSIGGYAFQNCKNITAEDLSNVTTFGTSALGSCERIEKIKLGSSLKSIGLWAFYGTGIASITIPKSVESIGKAALGRCDKLQSIKVEDGNLYYDSRNNCNGIFVKSTNTLLAGCMNTVIPEETGTIEYDAFYGHTGLKEIKLPKNLKAIVDYAFYNTGISTITIPETVDSIGDGAFRNCTNLSSFKVLRKEPIRVKETVFFSETDTIYTFDQVTLYVPEGTKAKYQEADGWKRFKNIEEIVEQQDKKVTSITLSCAELSMAPGEKNQLAATVLPEDATDKTVSWTTDNAAVATVSEQGLVTAVGQGTATITCRANDGSGVYATCEVTVKKRASWAGKYLVSGQHVEATSVTKVYPDNFEMTIEEKNGGTYITSMFGNDLTTWNEGGFKLEMNDDGTASVNLANDNVLDYVSDTGLLYAMYVWDDETEDWCDTWSLRLNEDGTISLGEFYVAAFTWDETDETWRGRTEALYYDLLAVKDDGSAVHEIAQDQPGIHVRNGVIELDEAADVTVYKENGMIVYQGKTDRVDGLAKGMYIVCVGEQRKKVMIRK